MGLLVSAGCGSEPTGGSPIEPPPVARINNGQPAASCQWPSTVALLNGSPFCSGTLIHPRVVLTAAHCIASQSPSAIGFGEDGFSPVRTVGVESCQMHPEYDRGLDIDLALCTLTDPVADVQPVPILLGCEQDVLQRPDPDIRIAGFGNTQTTFLNWEWYEGFGLGPKRHVGQSVFEIREAEQEIDLEGVNVMSGGCHGDSGGGAFVRLADGSWRVFGVAQSWNNVPGDPYDEGTSSGGAASSTGLNPDGPTATAGSESVGGGFIDPTDDGVGFIAPDDDGDEFVDVCGHGTTYSLVAPQMQWIEDVIGEDTSPCFTASGRWDPSPACTPFPMQIDQSVGSWDNGCIGQLGGEPQCGELDPVTGSSGTQGTSGLDDSTGAAPDDGTAGEGSTSDSGRVPADEGEGTAPPATQSGGAHTDGETDPAVDDDDDPGCSCRQQNRRPPAALWGLGVLGLFGRRRRPHVVTTHRKPGAAT